MSSSEELIQRYLDKILVVNETMNLTRITGGERARLLHIEDSLSGLQELQESPEGRRGSPRYEEVADRKSVV